MKRGDNRFSAILLMIYRQPIRQEEESGVLEGDCAMPLERELATYLRERPGWVAERLVGQWVVIHWEEVIGFFATLQAGLDAGYERFGPHELFMVRQIAEVDRPIQATR